MKTILRRVLAIVALVSTTQTAVAGNTWGTDLSDIWSTRNEDGWGVTFLHQQEIVFMGLYVYGPDNRPRWYSAALTSAGGSSPFQFSGDLLETNGPSFGGAFNPGNVTSRKVGTATLNAAFVSTASLSYTIDGVSVQKSISRFTLKSANLSGDYIGVIRGTTSGCAAGNGVFEDAGVFSVTHDTITSRLTLTASFSSGLSCTYSGTYQQSGRLGTITGSARCSNGSTSTFDAAEIEASYFSFNMRYIATYTGNCQDAGSMATLKRN